MSEIYNTTTTPTADTTPTYLDGTESTAYSGSGVQFSEEDNLTISTVESEEDSLGQSLPDGVEASATSQANETDDTDDTDDDTESTASEDMAVAASAVLNSVVLGAARSSMKSLDPIEALVSQFKRSDTASGTEPPELTVGSGAGSGGVGADFDPESGIWAHPTDGLTESFAAAMARMNQPSSEGGAYASLGSLLGYELIEA